MSRHKTAIEYGLIAASISVAIIATVLSLGRSQCHIQQRFHRHQIKAAGALPICQRVCVPKIRFGNTGGEVHREPAVK
jgi:Flp pilus assembly pilin Flp